MSRNALKVTCGLCKGVMIEEKTKDGARFWKCNDCGAETWPDEDTPEKVKRIIKKSIYTYDNMKAKSKKGSGSRVKNRNKKKAYNSLATERYRLE